MVRADKKICVVCMKSFDAYAKDTSHGHSISRRPSNSYTCSNACSKIYTRISDRVQKRLARKYKVSNSKVKKKV